MRNLECNPVKSLLYFFVFLHIFWVPSKTELMLLGFWSQMYKYASVLYLPYLQYVCSCLSPFRIKRKIILKIDLSGPRNSGPIWIPHIPIQNSLISKIIHLLNYEKTYNSPDGIRWSANLTIEWTEFFFKVVPVYLLCQEAEIMTGINKTCKYGFEHLQLRLHR